jgi:hypothetical protein
MRAADDAHSQRALRDFVGAKDFGAIHFLLAIEPHQPGADRGTRFRRTLRDRLTRFHDRANDLAISGAAAQHTADRIHHFGFIGRRIVFQ